MLYILRILYILYTLRNDKFIQKLTHVIYLFRCPNRNPLFIYLLTVYFVTLKSLKISDPPYFGTHGNSLLIYILVASAALRAALIQSRHCIHCIHRIQCIYIYIYCIHCIQFNVRLVYNAYFVYTYMDICFLFAYSVNNVSNG